MSMGLNNFDFEPVYNISPLEAFFGYKDKIESGEIVVNLNNGGNIYSHCSDNRVERERDKWDSL